MEKIYPVLIGADLNCYSVARAFHEKYGVVSYAFGKVPIGHTMNSRIVRFFKVEDIDDETVMMRVLADFAASHNDGKRFLFGCTDEYAEAIIRHRDELSADYFCNCCGLELAEKLLFKESFYGMCDRFSIDHPKTVVVKCGGSLPDDLPFEFPVIVKPSSSILYWRHPFDGMKKVYKAESREEAAEIIGKIFGSGYPDSIILQDFIPGGDDRMYVLTSYSGTDGKVKRMCLGHVLLEEHSPKARGNHAAIITEFKEELLETAKGFLESVGYRGFSNFDIKFDERDGKFKFFEINLRQGRSNYYVTSSGQNIAEAVVLDSEGKLSGCEMQRNAFFWHTVPRGVIYKYTADKSAVKTAKALSKKGRRASSLYYGYDLCMNPKRAFFVNVHNFRYFKKYRLYKI